MDNPLNQLKRFVGQAKASYSWNWGAFFCTYYWLLYRRLYGIFVIYIVLSGVVWAVIFQLWGLPFQGFASTLELGLIMAATMTPAMLWLITFNIEYLNFWALWAFPVAFILISAIFGFFGNAWITQKSARAKLNNTRPFPFLAGLVLSINAFILYSFLQDWS